MRSKAVVFIFVLCGLVHVQEVMGQDSLSLKLVGSVGNESVILRWAPPSPLSWKLLNEYGYKLYRYTVIRDSQVLSEKPMLVLQEGIKPASRQAWEEHMTNDYVSIAAQAIYGDEFEITQGAHSNLAQIVQRSRELDMRYSLALLAADVSSMTADLAGLRFVDTQIKKNEKYLYRIYSLVPESIMKVDFGYVFVDPQEERVLPMPPSPEIRRLETTVVLRWDTHKHLDDYTGYFVEKSIDDGLTFTRLNSLPIVNILTDETLKNENSFSVKTDSISGDVSKIVYVIRGVTAFGEIGPASEPTRIFEERPLTAVPAITAALIIDSGRVELHWTFSEVEQKELKAFWIERKTKENESYSIVSTPIEPKARSYIDKSPNGTNYYRVVAGTPSGQITASFPYMVQLEDSIPPLPPSNLVGSIDSTGVILLKWDENLEKDLVGYRVYRSNFKNSEFSQVTVSPITDRIFRDTVNIKTLGKSVWYRLAAVDNRFNSSLLSNPIEINLPDVVPPVPPVVRSIRSKAGGIEIQWIPSSSEDVRVHQVYRKNQSSSEWELVEQFFSTDSCCYFFDQLNTPQRHQYSLVAVDDVGLKSTMTRPVWGMPLAITERRQITDVQIMADRMSKVVLLNWSYKESPEKFLIYRSVNGEPIFLYRSVNGTVREFQDTNLQINSNYEYRIKAVFKDGSESIFSDKVSVSY